MKRCVVVLIVALLTLNLIGIVHAGEGQWERQNPLPTGASLYGVWGSDANDVFAVGGGTTIPHYDGNVWTTTRGDPNLELEGMWGHVSSDIFTVGRDGVLRTPATAPFTMDTGIAPYTLIPNAATTSSPEVPEAAGSVSALDDDCQAKVGDTVYDIVQKAIDDAEEGDTVLVSGYCSGTEIRGGLPQVAYIDKALTLQGGWNSDFDDWDPATYTTTLDALGEGRVVYITGDIEARVESFEITGGDAQGLGGVEPDDIVDEPIDVGGGIYVITATAVISGNTIYQNSAEVGGGVFVMGATTEISGNTIHGNSADVAGGGVCLAWDESLLSTNTIVSNGVGYGGGGIVLFASSATLEKNTISGNSAEGIGAGLFLYQSDASVTGNAITENVAQDAGGGLFSLDSSPNINGNTFSENSTEGFGAGLYLYQGDASVTGNEITENVAQYLGGGLYLEESDEAVLTENTISGNIAWEGAGLYLYQSDASVTGNAISENVAQDTGGGLFSDDSSPNINGNTFSENSAELSGGGLYFLDSGHVKVQANTIISNSAQYGGGISLNDSNDNVMINNVIAGNESEYGGGVEVYCSSADFVHTTLADNLASGTGAGVYVNDYGDSPSSTVWLTNTIIANHEVGVYAGENTTINMSATLWWENDEDISGSGSVSHTDDHDGDPVFVDADSGDYHLGSTSAAIDKGRDAGVTRDLDGNPRPHGAGPDIGAYEYQGDAGSDVYLPIILKGSR